MNLLIEDNPIDAEAVTRAFASLDYDHAMVWTETGDVAIVPKKPWTP